MRALSGNHSGWLTTVAKEVREAGKPVSLDHLCRVVPGQFATSVNDGHVTAAENGLDRDDYKAGQRIWVEESVAALRKAGLVGGPDDALVWTAEQDGVWKVPFRPRSTPTVYGRAQSLAARDRHMLGYLADGNTPSPGYLLKGWSEAEVEVEVGVGEIRKGRHTFQVHPLAFAIPPMTPEEQEAMRADIAAHGVRQPLILYVDEADKTVRGKPKAKVLDGRHRLHFASVLGKPVRIELFEGNEQDARDLVASLNLQRRHLTPAQRGLAIVQLYGEQAKQEAKAEQIASLKQNATVSAKLPTRSDGKSEPRGWENRAVKLAGGPAAGVSARNVRHMDEVAKTAPKTAAKVASGEIRTVTKAVEQARIERGTANPLKPSEPVWQESVRGELRRARGHLRNVLERLDLPLGIGSPSELRDLAEDVETLAARIGRTLKERGVVH